MRLRASYLAIHRLTDASLSDLGITADQFVCLLILRRRHGIIQRELVDLATSDPNTIRAMLVLLEDKGYVMRRRHSGDKRARIVRITPKGREVARLAYAALSRIHKWIGARISREEAAVINSVLTRVAEALPCAAAPAPLDISANRGSIMKPPRAVVGIDRS